MFTEFWKGFNSSGIAVTWQKLFTTVLVSLKWLLSVLEEHFSAPHFESIHVEVSCERAKVSDTFAFWMCFLRKPS